MMSDTLSGETVALVGECDALGCWEPSRGVAMTRTTDDSGRQWRCTVPVPADIIQFKFVRVSERGVCWEFGNNRYATPSHTVSLRLHIGKGHDVGVTPPGFEPSQTTKRSTAARSRRARSTRATRRTSRRCGIRSGSWSCCPAPTASWYVHRRLCSATCRAIHSSAGSVACHGCVREYVCVGVCIRNWRTRLSICTQ